MRADIGINPDGRPFLEIRPESMSERMLLQHFAKDLGLDFDLSVIGAPFVAYLAAKEIPTP